MSMTSRLVISLDFELLWGVRDVVSKDAYGRNILGVRDAVPALLEAFERNAIRATWATVGMLLCETKDEILSRAPKERPTYENHTLSSYSYMHEVGANENADPYHFGMSLARRILSCPGQEMSTHTFSHYYCLEPGQTPRQFEADLQAALKMFKDMGIACRSIVFPRNQYDSRALSICAGDGVAVYRGTRETWLYRATMGANQTLLRRAARLADAYIDLSAVDRFAIRSTSEHANPSRLINTVGDRFLRPWNARLSVLEGVRSRRILNEMSAAAAQGHDYHLWWHPHNFGTNLTENMAALRTILAHFRVLRETFGMESASMEDCATWQSATAKAPS